MTWPTVLRKTLAVGSCHLAIAEVSTTGVVIVPGPNVWAWSMAGSDRQHQEEDASARLHYLSERLYRCGSLLLIGQAYCRRQRASQKPSFLIHLASTAKVSDF